MHGSTSKQIMVPYQRRQATMYASLLTINCTRQFITRTFAHKSVAHRLNVVHQGRPLWRIVSTTTPRRPSQRRARSISYSIHCFTASKFDYTSTASIRIIESTAKGRIFHSGQRKFLSRTFYFCPTAAQCRLWSRILPPLSLLDFCSFSSLSRKTRWEHHFAIIAISWKKATVSIMVLLAVVVDRTWAFISLRATKNSKNCYETRVSKIRIKIQSPAWRVMIWFY